MRKRKNSNGAKLQKALVQYLLTQSNHPDPEQQAVSRELLRAKYNLSNSSLSEHISAINKSYYRDFTLKSQKGKVRLIRNVSSLSEVENTLQYEEITDKTILQCLIMYQLKQNKTIGYNKKTLKKNIADQLNPLKEDDSDDDDLYNLDSSPKMSKDSLEIPDSATTGTAVFSNNALDEALISLRKEELIEATKDPVDGNTLYYSLSNAYTIYEKEYSNLSENLNDLHLNSIARIWKPLESVLQNFKLLSDSDSTDTLKDIYVIGRKTIFDPTQIEKYNKLLKLPFKEKVLKLKYKSGKKVKEYDFKTGLIYFSTETGQFYLVGKCGKQELSLRLSDVTLPDQASSQSNDVYMSSHYKNVFEEIFQSEFEGRRHHVKVRFDKLKNTEDKLHSLVSVRHETASYQSSKDGNSYIYEDTIRGLNSFARYLRAYGRAAIVSEPEPLILLMCRSAIRTIQKYEKEWNQQ